MIDYDTISKMSSKNPYLLQMQNLVRDEKRIHPLTVEDCFPYLLKIYRHMSINNQQSREIFISEIMKALDSEEVEYRCDDQDALSHKLCDTLNENGIPANLLIENRFSNTTMEYMFAPGIILKLYR